MHTYPWPWSFRRAGISVPTVRLVATVAILSITSARDRGLGDARMHPKTNANLSNAQRPPPPPPPPPPSLPIDPTNPSSSWPEAASSEATSINPIHYNFPMLDESIHSNPLADQRSKSASTLPSPTAPFASARQDAVTRFSSTPLGKLKLTTSSTLVGSILGSFIGKSIFGHAMPLSSIFASLFLLATFFRNDYGDLSKSLGLALIYMLDRVHRVRRRYPTGPGRILAALGLRNRSPFPPFTLEENPWSYQPMTRTDPEFHMIQTMVALAVLGSFTGGSVPGVPTWIGSSVGALAWVWLGTRKTGRGDLVRIVGMRVVAMVLEAWEIQGQLRIGRKSSVVAGRIFDKVMILDRKHRIKDKLILVFNWVYDKLASMASQVQKEESPKPRGTGSDNGTYNLRRI